MCTLFDVRKHSALQTQGVDTLHKKDVYGLWRDKMRQGRDCEAQCCIRPHAHTKDEAQLQEDMAGCGLGGNGLCCFADAQSLQSQNYQGLVFIRSLPRVNMLWC